MKLGCAGSVLKSEKAGLFHVKVKSCRASACTTTENHSLFVSCGNVAGKRLARSIVAVNGFGGVTPSRLKK